jgi:uncharacterized NAD(P)/FAD-binding protein YdhS
MFFGGSSSGMLAFIADTQDSVKSVVVEQQRQQEALITVKATRKRTQKLNKDIKRLMKQLQRELRDHGVQKGDIEAIWDEYYKLENDHAADLVDLRFQLREQLTRVEWEQVFSAQ